MARVYEPTLSQVAAWVLQVRSMTAAARAVWERVDPWTLYRIKPNGFRVLIGEVSDDGAIKVNLSPDYNFLIGDAWISGVKVDELEECDLPAPDELVGREFMIGGFGA